MKHPRILARGWLLAFSALLLAAPSSSVFAAVPVSTQAAAQELVDAFAGTLTGAQEVPPQTSTATGAGTVVINAATLRMTAVLTTAGIPAIAAHIQEGQPGISGPIIFPLVETQSGSGIWTASGTLTEAQYNTFKTGAYYFNVHSLAFPDGEIRGQIVTQQAASVSSSVLSTADFLAALRGSQEVPPNGSTAIGAGTVLLDPSTRQLSAAVATSDIAGIAAHIHQAPPGVSGPIIVPLTEASLGTGIWTANTTLTEEQFAALQAGDMYFNVHSATFPEGEIRGQVIAQELSPADVTGMAGGATPSAPAASLIGAPAPLPPAPTTGTIGETTPNGTGTGSGTTGTPTPLPPAPDRNLISDVPESASLAY
jgi:hypothetical protein